MRVAVAGTLGLAWLLFLLAVAMARPRGVPLGEVARLVPDVLRLLRRLVSDRSIRLSARLPVWLLILYLAIPIDVVPDFVPVLGYADDAILVSLVLRRLVRSAGEDKLGAHWPGSPDRLVVLRRALRLGSSAE